jgi:Domain of unknown function (DUF1887).
MGIISSDANTEKILVDQDSFTDCINKIEALVEKHDGTLEYIVNITGATKVMALAAYEIFRDLGQKVLIVYIPLGKNDFFQIFPRRKPLKMTEVKERLTLEQYLSSYGFTIINKKIFPMIKTKVILSKPMSEWILYHYEQLKGLLGFFYQHLGKKRDEKTYLFTGLFDRGFAAVEMELLDKCAFEVRENSLSKNLTKDEIVYFTGGWLEDYVFNELHTLVQDGHFNDAMIGVKIESLNGASNELDIAFMKDNIFHYIECKTLSDKGERNIINDEVYKKGALSTLLGKGEKRAFICTTHKTISKALAARGKDYGVKIFNIDEVKNIKDILLKKFTGTTREPS